MLVLGTVGSDGLDLSIVSADGESESDNRVTRANYDLDQGHLRPDAR